MRRQGTAVHNRQGLRSPILEMGKQTVAMKVTQARVQAAEARRLRHREVRSTGGLQKRQWGGQPAVGARADEMRSRARQAAT
jgi:hypothetical protein